MVQMGLLFLGFTLLVCLLALLAAVYYIPKVLAEAYDKEEHEPEGESV